MVEALQPAFSIYKMIKEFYINWKLEVQYISFLLIIALQRQENKKNAEEKRSGSFAFEQIINRLLTPENPVSFLSRLNCLNDGN